MKDYSSNLHWSVTLIISMILAIGTWNPTEHNFVNYIMNLEDILSGFQPFFILLVLILWMLALKSIFQTLKLYGVIITIILIAAFIMGLSQSDLIDFSNPTQIGWIISISIGLIIWIGLNASIFWKKITGVYTTDETVG